MNTIVGAFGAICLARAVSRGMRFIVLALGLALLVALVSPKANAAATSARHGTVVAVQEAAVTPSQRSYDDSYGYNYNNSYQSPDHSRAAVGAAIGGLIGAIAGRHSYQGRWMGSAAGAAIGGAVGYAADHRAYEREQQTRVYQQARQDIGVQVIVKLDGGQTVAVFTNRPSGIYPGAKVWLIGNDELIADN